MDFTTRGTVEEAVSTFNVSQRGAFIYVHYDFGTLVKKLLGNPWSPDNPNGLLVHLTYVVCHLRSRAALLTLQAVSFLEWPTML
jgi:hypothetical protein